MAFDITTAKPIEKKETEFDLTTAQPIGQPMSPDKFKKSVESSFDITTAEPIEPQKEFDLTTAKPIPDAKLIPVDEEDIKATGFGTDLLRVFADTVENLNPVNIYYTGRVLGEDIKGALGFNNKSEQLRQEQEAFQALVPKYSPDTFHTALRALDKTEDVYTPEGKVKDTETVGGDIASIVPYMVGGVKVYKKLGDKGSEFLRGLKAGAITDFVLGDVDEGVMADVIVDIFPEAGNNVIVDLMTTKEDSTTLARKAKIVIEGGIIGAGFDAAMGIVKFSSKVFGKKPETTLQELTEKSDELYGKPLDDLNPEEIENIIVKSDIIISSRFHSMVVGLNNNVVPIVLGWNSKYIEVLKEFEIEKNYIDNFENTILLNSKDKKNLVETINNFLKQEKLISDKNRKQIENSYSTQKVASQFSSIYKKQDIG